MQLVTGMMTKTMAHHEGRLQAAGLNAMAAHRRVSAKASALIEEMEEVTSPHGIKVVDLDDEDSMVIAVDRVLQDRRAKTGT